MPFLGDSSAATGEDGTGGYRVAVPVVAGADGSVTDLYAWARNAVAANAIDIGIKDDNAGLPGILLSSTGSLAESVGASIALHSGSIVPVSIVNGATYWIELCNRVGAATFGDHKAGLLTGGTLYYCSGLGFAGDDNWSSEVGVGTSPGNSLAAYALYTPSGGSSASQPGLPDPLYTRPMAVNQMTGPWGMVAEQLRALGSTRTRADYTLTADVATFALAGNATGLAFGHKLAASVGTFTLTGNATALKADRKLAAAVATFTETGTATGLKVDRKLTAGVGTFTLTGIDVGLNYSSSASTYTLSAGTGAFTFTGVAANLKVARKLTADQATFTETGNATTLRAGRMLQGSTGAFTETGIAAAFKVARQLSAGAGAFTLTGQATGLVWSGATVVGALTGSLLLSPSLSGTLQVSPSLDGTLAIARSLSGSLVIE